ncbi:MULTISPECIES: helix-turn-helix domain-containing protein [Herbaspirillum]|uniref:Helix-turn-helix domain-containing protein n=2 Tax=Oxalobacteraceae TaxID=75682 RepID=A0AAD0UDX5_9BURK|nr:helix-turn-helix domain-containing protein [Herbaspirillum rubrisubalbicans]
MSYAEILKMALDGKSVNSLAKQWGIPQPTLDKYARGERLPSFKAAKAIAEAAGVSAEQMLESLALEEETRKGYNRAPSADVAQLVEQLIRNQ